MVELKPCHLITCHLKKLKEELGTLPTYLDSDVELCSDEAHEVTCPTGEAISSPMTMTPQLAEREIWKGAKNNPEKELDSDAEKELDNNPDKGWSRSH